MNYTFKIGKVSVQGETVNFMQSSHKEMTHDIDKSPLAVELQDIEVSIEDIKASDIVEVTTQVGKMAFDMAKQGLEAEMQRRNEERMIREQQKSELEARRTKQMHQRKKSKPKFASKRA